MSVTEHTSVAQPAGNPGPATAKILSFPLNTWYVAAWDHEVTNKAPLSRRVCDKPLALWRTTDGRVVVLADACWHRLAPLSRGAVVGDEIQCPYHGMRYDAAGRCTHMPAQRTINPAPPSRHTPPWSAIASSGSGSATRTWPTRTPSPTCTR